MPGIPGFRDPGINSLKAIYVSGFQNKFHVGRLGWGVRLMAISIKISALWAGWGQESTEYCTGNLVPAENIISDRFTVYLISEIARNSEGRMWSQPAINRINIIIVPAVVFYASFVDVSGKLDSKVIK